MDRAEIILQRLARDLSNRPRKLYACGASANDDEGEPCMSLRGIGKPFGHLKSAQNLSADAGGLFDAF